ncbi:hypothetical protein IFM89_038652 [Coptis chinensis]|uniref:Uncharacterized protein n=1 Tax=Coptis chinensis TaxID=261450 RepID=A0A835I416_9MAGN|nr:hypothetical protein IFM89_038652 [Coptis chinensis]
MDASTSFAFHNVLTDMLWHFGQVNDPPVRNSQEAFMMEMRAARMAVNRSLLALLGSSILVNLGFGDLNRIDITLLMIAKGLLHS